MKKQFYIGGIFLISYIVFLIATLPTNLLLNQIKVPKNISIYGVTGTIWNTNIEQLVVEKTSIKKVNAQLSFWSLFTLTPKLAITFGDSFVAGPEGKLNLVLSQQKAHISDFTMVTNANDIAQQLTLPLPMTAQGDVEVVLVNAEIDLKKGYQCIAVKGNAQWTKAGVDALEQKVKLGDLQADIVCENGALSLNISPKNDLGLTFKATMSQSGKISGNGFLKPGAKFPKALNDVLPFLGAKDSQGRYRLYF